MVGVVGVVVDLGTPREFQGSSYDDPLSDQAAAFLDCCRGLAWAVIAQAVIMAIQEGSSRIDRDAAWEFWCFLADAHPEWLAERFERFVIPEVKPGDSLPHLVGQVTRAMRKTQGGGGRKIREVRE